METVRQSAFDAVNAGNVEVIGVLLDSTALQANSPLGHELAIEAAILNDYGIVRRLLVAGANVNANHGELLMTAVLHDSQNVVDALLEVPDIDATLDDGSAFTFAYRLNCTDILGDLLVWHCEKHGKEATLAYATTLLQIPVSGTCKGPGTVLKFMDSLTASQVRRSGRKRKAVARTIL